MTAHPVSSNGRGSRAGRRGLTLSGIPLAELGARAAQAEAAGFDSVWVAETDHSSTIQAAVVANTTAWVTVGTNVALAFPRSPALAAQEAWDLQELTDGRFVLGLGSQVRRIIEDHYSAAFDRPAQRMGEYVDAMRAVWDMARGTNATFDGDLYRVLRPAAVGLGKDVGRQDPKVLVAAVGPLMTRAALQHADGILGHPFTSARYLTQDLIPRVEATAEDLGRQRQDVEICQGVIVSVADDRETAVRAAKRQIGFYGTTPNYGAVFDSCGDSEMTETLRRVWKRTGGDSVALEDAVPDRAVERYAAAGTPDEVRDRLESLEALVDRVIVTSPWYGVSAGDQRENLEAVIETLGPGIPARRRPGAQQEAGR